MQEKPLSRASGILGNNDHERGTGAWGRELSLWASGVPSGSVLTQAARQ
jgi:hypothetical protein